MTSTSLRAGSRLSVFRFPIDRLDDAVQDPSFLLLVEQGWRPVLTWVVEEERARGSVPPTMLVVMAPPYTPTAPSIPVQVTVEAPTPPPAPLLTRAVPVASLVLLLAILVSLWLT